MSRDIELAPEAEPVVDSTLDTVLGIARDVLGRPEIGADDDLFDLGATSLSFVRVLAQIHRKLHARVPAAALGGVATPRNLAACAGRELDSPILESGRA
jgi:hypothetical protein